MPTPLQPGRRTILKSLLLTSAGTVCSRAFANEPVSRHSALPAWTEGQFDIHHIDTARGNCTLLIFPDGTTMMIDAGDAGTAPEGTIQPTRPNASRRPGEWQARYALAHAPSPQLDYFLATHIHPDHVSGLADVDAAMPVATLIDRSFPVYAPNQQPSHAPFAKQYLDLLKLRTAQGRTVVSAQVGSPTQITPRKKPQQYGNFQARILSANGRVWNPRTQTVDAHLGTLPSGANTHGYENSFSVATRFTYGAFTYFTGGDLDADTFDGREPELDVEAPVVHAAGRTEVAVADHHGYFDACGPAFTNTLDAQAYIVLGWDIGHPGSAQMERMLGAWDLNGGKATHDVFVTSLLPANALLNRRFAPQLKSQQGHIVVRVAPGGGTYMIYTLDSSVESGAVTGIAGPYRSRSSAEDPARKGTS